MGLFGSRSSSSESSSNVARVTRHSSGWLQMLKHLGTGESYRVLDFGPTSAGNINLITTMGHSIYMANLVDDAARPEYLLPSVEGEPAVFDTERFLAENFDFRGRVFDVVLLWDTLDYLPKELVQPITDRLFEVMSPLGQLLAIFHSSATPGTTAKPTAEDLTFSRYHLTETANLELQRIGGRPLKATYTNRQVEAFFHLYTGYKFFLAKDALREVIVTR
jgi:hypothetical protein